MTDNTFTLDTLGLSLAMIGFVCALTALAEDARLGLRRPTRARSCAVCVVLCALYIAIKLSVPATWLQ